MKGRSKLETKRVLGCDDMAGKTTKKKIMNRKICVPLGR